MIPLRWLLGADLHFLGNIGSSTINKNCGYNSRVSNARHSWARSRLRGDHPLVSPEPVSGPRGSAEGLKDYFRIADDPSRTSYFVPQPGFWNACAGSGLTSKWTRAGTRRAQFLVSGETAELSTTASRAPRIVSIGSLVASATRR